jgi:hypothetical protein
LLRTALFLVGAVLLAGPAAADVRDVGSRLQFFSPRTAWAVAIPKDDWVVAQEKRRPDGSGFYYLVSSRSRSMQFSMYLDRTAECASGEACRALFWSNPGPMFRDARDVRQYERNGFHVVQFYLDGVAGFPMKQANVSAHMYRDGYWIDIRATKVGEEVPDPAPIIEFLDSVSVQ